MLKKGLIAVAIFLGLIIGAMVVLPILFKDEIFALAEREANNNLNAKVSIGDLDLSLFRSFPDFSLEIKDITVDGVNDFEGIQLANIPSLYLSLDLMSVISGGQIQVNSVSLDDARIHVIVLEDGTANYDIAKAAEEVAEEVAPETPEGEGGFSVGLKEYAIRNAQVIYDDRAGGIYAKLQDFTHEGSGDFTQDDFLLHTETTASAIDFTMDGVPYLNRTVLDMKFDVNMNLPNMKFEFAENYVQLNALRLGFEGMVAMPVEEGDPIDMDLKFETRETTFKSLLSMVPAIYMTDFEDVETEGSLALSGMAKGRMVGDQLPAFALDLTVSDAMFHYPDMPESAKNIQIDLHTKNPGGSEDNTIVDLNKFHAELAGNPVDVVLHMRTPISDPYIEADIVCDLDMGSLADVIPLEEGQKITGQLKSNVHLKGNQSAIDQERYNDFHAEGTLELSNFDYVDPELAYETLIEKCSLEFTPSTAWLRAFYMKVGSSDIQMRGHVDNIVQWYVADAPLVGAFVFHSDHMDINEFLTEDEEEAADETGDAGEGESSSDGVAEIPAGFNFQLDATVDELIYENLLIKNVKGKVALHDHILDMKRLAMELLGGKLVIDGSYATINPVSPEFDLSMDVVRWDIAQTYEFLEIAQKMAPVMENADGSFSTLFDMSGRLDNHMEPRMETLNGKGKLKTHQVTLNNPPVLEKAAKAIKYDGLSSMQVTDAKLSFKVKDGRVSVEPMDYVIGKEIPSVFLGSHGLDGSLDYTLKLDIPTRLMGSAASAVVGDLVAKAGKALGADAQLPERIKVDLLIGGMSDDPSVTPQFKGTEGEGSLKDQAMDQLNEKKEELEQQAKEELNKAKDDAETRAREEAEKAKQELERKKEEARKKAEEEKKKAEEAARKKAEEAKKKAAEEAKKKLKGLIK